MNVELLREQLVGLLKGGFAHMGLEKALREYPHSVSGSKVPGSTNSPWRLLEHIRIAQWDILEFSRDPHHVSPEFPDGYWPNADAPSDDEDWNRSVEAVIRDLEAMIELVNNPSTDLLSPIPHGSGQTVLREALLVADHNAYHLGQLMTLRRALS